MRLKIILLLLLCSSVTFAQEHPSLLLTPESVELIKTNRGKSPAFDASVDKIIESAEREIAKGIDVPIPKDAAGAYTHERHKDNYMAMYNAGVAYQLTGENKYADFVIAMLLDYADMYPTLPMHPITTSPVRGKLFWQTLNDSVWLVHTAVAYDCVYDRLTNKQRKKIERDLFYPATEFFMNGTESNHRTFNKMHNHGTWSTAGVGMIGYAMGDQNLVDMALYGTNKNGVADEGTPAGFINQIDELFSPEGYFTEGPYYQRYSIWPFMLFSQSIQNRQPELKIYEQKDGVLAKAVTTLIGLSYDGHLMMFNDGLEKTFNTQELIIAFDVAYSITKDPKLLSLIKDQDQFFVSEAGWKAASALIDKQEQPFSMESTYLRDGAKGDQGGVAIMRNQSDGRDICLVLKATSHGLSHGHFDKLNITLYENGYEILTDYGASRFLNIEAKSGGRYTTENNTYSKQSIAHNTVVVDEESHYGGVYKLSSKHSPQFDFVALEDEKMQVVAATDKDAYASKGVVMQRALALVDNGFVADPFILDLFRLTADKAHKYDLALHYNGHLVNANYDSSIATQSLAPMGSGHGYQHFWKEGEMKVEKESVSFTWLKGDKFYSSTTSVDPAAATVFHLRTGANDPHMNLRSEPAVVVRQEGKSTHTFASIIEMHGIYDLNIEKTERSTSEIKSIETIYEDDNYTAVEVVNIYDKRMIAIITTHDMGDKSHTISAGGKSYTWSGNYYIAVE